MDKLEAAHSAIYRAYLKGWKRGRRNQDPEAQETADALIKEVAGFPFKKDGPSAPSELRGPAAQGSLCPTCGLSEGADRNPTPWAYQQACEAIRTLRARLEALESPKATAQAASAGAAPTHESIYPCKYCGATSYLDSRWCTLCASAFETPEPPVEGDKGPGGAGPYQRKSCRFCGASVIAHVIEEGARYHVFRYTSLGRTCSEPNCEENHTCPPAPGPSPEGQP